MGAMPSVPGRPSSCQGNTKPPGRVAAPRLAQWVAPALPRRRPGAVPFLPAPRHRRRPGGLDRAPRRAPLACHRQPPRRRAAGGHPWTPSAWSGCPSGRWSTRTPTATPSPAGRQALTERGMAGEIAARGLPAPIQAGRRWGIERTPHAWAASTANCAGAPERRRLVVECWLASASTVVILGRLLRRAWACYRWHTRPRRRP